MLVTVNDKKLGVSSNNTTIDYFNPQVVSARDYYPFGMLQPGRSVNVSEYRYGFNGKENDNEVKGEGNQQDYGMRVYDPRLGKFLSVDPLTKSYPSWSPYPFAMNRPVDGMDLDGAEWSQKTTMYKKSGWTITEFTIVIKVKNSSSILSDAQVWAMATSMKAGIEAAFTKKFQNEKKEFKANVQFVKDNNANSNKDFFFDFIDSKVSGKTYVAGKATGGNGNSDVNRIEIVGTINGITLKSAPTRVASHELGHTGGLEHPHQPHDNDKLMPKTEYEYQTGQIPDNLMIWGVKGGYSTGLTSEQLSLISITIEKNSNKIVYEQINPTSSSSGQPIDATFVRKDNYVPTKPKAGNSQFSVKQ